MKQILVPVNLRSDYANLLDYACAMATRANASLTLLFAASRRTFTQGNTHVFNAEEGEAKANARIKHPEIRETLHQLISHLNEKNVQFRVKMVVGSAVYSIIREANTKLYDLVLMGGNSGSNLLGTIRGTVANRVMGDIQTPLFVIPTRTPFSGIDHISYAVDLEDYDPAVIQQVREIAELFDAKLSIVHVNKGEENPEESNSRYRECLEQTISATLDYPKVYYKFFDHADPLGGILKHLRHTNSNLLAMTNRKKFSWSSLFSGKSLTHRMAKDLQIPLLAFRK